MSKLLPIVGSIDGARALAVEAAKLSHAIKLNSIPIEAVNRIANIIRKDTSVSGIDWIPPLTAAEDSVGKFVIHHYGKRTATDGEPSVFVRVLPIA